MFRNRAHLLTATACLALVSCSNDAETVDQPVGLDRSVDIGLETTDANVSILDGHWSGSWGGGAQGDVIFQPVLAELVIEGDQVELSGFPDTADITGTIRVDADAHRMVLTATGDGVLEYTYEVSGDQLTLTTGNGRTVSMLKQHDAPVGATDEGVPEP